MSTDSKQMTQGLESLQTELHSLLIAGNEVNNNLHLEKKTLSLSTQSLDSPKLEELINVFHLFHIIGH